VSFKVAKVQDVAQGVQKDQFTVVSREQKDSLEDLDPVYRQLLDEPVTAVIAVMGGDGRPWLTPVWFNYTGGTVLLNLAEHRRKTQWIRRNPQVTMLLMNPKNPYHWVRPSTPAPSRPMACATRPWTSGGCCSSAASTASPSSGSPRRPGRASTRRLAPASRRGQGRPGGAPVSSWPRVAVVGGSLGGLTAALVLRDLGCEVDVFERSTAELESRGAGIVVLDETVRYFRERTDLEVDRLTTATGFLRYLGRDGAVVYEEPRRYRYSSWHTIYRALLGCFGRGRYHLGKEVAGFRQRGERVEVGFADGATAAYDLLVCADGISSGARARLQPQARPAYAGYVAWRGVVEERRLGRGARDLLADSICYQVIPNSHILLYPIPALDGSVAPGRRLANFVWYRNYAAGEALDDLMTDRDGVRRDVTLPPGAARDAHLEELRAVAEARLAPQLAEVVQRTERPFVQVIFDIEVDQMAFGRVCLLGDAAFALRPHAAAGTAKAAADAWALAEALAATQGDVEAALPRWERRQLAVGRAVLERTRRNGNKSQFAGTWRPGDPELVFGLYEPGR
jgi:2,6-dihydroxypyridine 3-monooxygenase